MVEVRHAPIAYAAVLRPQWPQTATAVAEPGQNDVSLLPLVKVRDLLDRPVVGVGVEWDVAGIAPVRYDPANPHDRIPVDEAVVRPSQYVPRDWNALKRMRSLCDFSYKGPQ